MLVPALEALQKLGWESSRIGHTLCAVCLKFRQFQPLRSAMSRSQLKAQRANRSKAAGEHKRTESELADALPSGRGASAEQPVRWWQGTLAIALVGSVLLWLAFPPVNWWPLAWVAPVPWLMLVRMKELPGRRPHRALWFAGFAFWMGALHWLRLPYWATSFGWVALSIYLGLYLPLFVVLARRAVHGWGLSLVWVAPVIWTSLELVRGHLLGGFLMAAVGHTQSQWLEMIQISDLGGGYAVTFLVMFVAACLTRMWPLGEGRKTTLWPAFAAVAALVAVWGYGSYRMAAAEPEPGPTVLLVQGSIDTEMKADPALRAEVYRQYFTLSQRGTMNRDDIDLVIWPETMFRETLFSHDEDAKPPADADWTIEELADAERHIRQLISDTAIAIGAPMILGLDCVHFRAVGDARHNSAMLVAADGELSDRYDKMHPVLFGEYIPLGDKYPWLYSLSPLSNSVLPGERPVAIEVAGARFAPSICYENILPHLIAGQVRTLREAGEEPDVLVNLTNDGWFWGSSELDMHLTCALFRAVECRKPMLVAANTGFSAWIDGDGRIVQQGPRRDTGTIVAEVNLDPRQSLYLTLGDWPWAICLLFSMAVALDLTAGERLRRQKNAISEGSDTTN